MAEKRTTAELDRLTLYPATPPDTASPDSTTPSTGLSVSGVDKIIGEIRNRICGRVEVEEEWWCISLSHDEFKAFKARFEAEGDYLWPKYDYFPQLAKFVLHGGSHCPDGSFTHEDTTELGVILEVSHSQKFQDLPFLADEYILGSNGLTQAVIGIDLEYQGKGARVQVWRPNKTKKDGKTALTAKETFKGTFRDTNGNLVHGGRNLRIWLKDFGNELDCPGIQKAKGVITISFAQLYELVQKSEAFDQARKRRRGSDEVLEGRSRQKMVKQKTVYPSPEKLTTSDEERFKAAEEEVEKQLSDQDGDYILE
ncbi:hypothetical protein C7999DRAFT_33936 [Corynascus novoguineensis]|uniref:Uncharacterized protein n=1 Tax=Corynascus novoguineensis TaxID=1126955 RepID=A0AAN7CPN3_9PEZI|nr:hypothetical protein C7999DRAFT_33936 [Corynascus novoguineensis]